MSTHRLVVDLILLAIAAIGGVLLLSVTLVWLLDLLSEDPRPPKHRRQVYSPEPVASWVEDLPRARTPWDVPPLVRAEIEIAALYRVIDMIAVPQLRPAWVAETKRQLEIEAGL